MTPGIIPTPGVPRGRSGLTLVELMVSMGILMVVLVGLTSLLRDSIQTTDRTTSQSDINSAAAVASELVEQYLAEARSVTVDTNGLGVTFKKPAPGTGGDFYSLNPNAVESTARRLYVEDGELIASSPDESDRVLLTDIPATDPETGATLRVFSVGLNSREIVVRLASKRASSNGRDQYSALTTRVQPRNML